MSKTTNTLIDNYASRFSQKENTACEEKYLCSLFYKNGVLQLYTNRNYIFDVPNMSNHFLYRKISIRYCGQYTIEALITISSFEQAVIINNSCTAAYMYVESKL